MQTFYLADFLEKGIESAFRACFSAARKNNGPVKIVIAPGEYPMSPMEPIELFSDLSIEAEGAKFIWPLHWTGPVHRDMFKGVDICNFSWNGGCFEGHVFDVPPAIPTWEPECCARCIVIETTADGRTENLHFQNIDMLLFNFSIKNFLSRYKIYFSKTY